MTEDKSTAVLQRTIMLINKNVDLLMFAYLHSDTEFFEFAWGELKKIMDYPQDQYDKYLKNIGEAPEDKEVPSIYTYSYDDISIFRAILEHEKTNPILKGSIRCEIYGRAYNHPSEEAFDDIYENDNDPVSLGSMLKCNDIDFLLIRLSKCLSKHMKGYYQ